MNEIQENIIYEPISAIIIDKNTVVGFSEGI